MVHSFMDGGRWFCQRSHALYRLLILSGDYIFEFEW